MEHWLLLFSGGKKKNHRRRPQYTRLMLLQFQRIHEDAFFLVPWFSGIAREMHECSEEAFQGRGWGVPFVSSQGGGDNPRSFCSKTRHADSETSRSCKLLFLICILLLFYCFSTWNSPFLQGVFHLLLIPEFLGAIVILKSIYSFRGSHSSLS